MQYAQDYDDFTPSGWRIGDVRYTYISRIDPYLKTRKVWRCPSDSDRPEIADVPNADGFASSYSYNAGPISAAAVYDASELGGLFERLDLNPASGTAYVFRGRHLASLNDAANFFVLTDSGSSGGFSFSSPAGIVDSQRATEGKNQRHGRWINCLFADGHVKAVAFRYGRGTIETSGSNIYLALPMSKAYYNSWCASPDLSIITNSRFAPCSTAVDYSESKVTAWLAEQ